MKKILIIIGIAIGVIIIGILGYAIVRFLRSGSGYSQTTTWVQAQFPDGYRHAVNIMLPSTWTFDCCNATDSFSAHSIYPPSSVTNPDTSSTITVFDFVLSGCPDGEYASCGIDEQRRVTAAQYGDSLVKHLRANGEVAGMRQLQATVTVNLRNIPGVRVYSGISSSNQPVELYLIQSSQGVVGVAFQQIDRFDQSLVTGFLSKLTVSS